jgi:hypothetical protein
MSSKLLAQVFARVSELPEDIQDMVARQLNLLLEDEPERGDDQAVERGRRDFAKGDYITLDQWRHDVGLGDR